MRGEAMANEHEGPREPKDMLGTTVEVRTAGGGSYRGCLEAVGSRYLTITHRNTGRSLLVPVAAVTAILDAEQPAEIVNQHGRGW